MRSRRDEYRGFDLGWIYMSRLPPDLVFFHGLLVRIRLTGSFVNHYDHWAKLKEH
jgi:hypothetical protein